MEGGALLGSYNTLFRSYIELKYNSNWPKFDEKMGWGGRFQVKNYILFSRLVGPFLSFFLLLNNPSSRSFKPRHCMYTNIEITNLFKSSLR